VLWAARTTRNSNARGCLSRRRSTRRTSVQSFANESLNHGLAADIHFFGGFVKFRKHWPSKVHIHSLDRVHHSQAVGKKTANVLPSSRHAGNLFGADGFLFLGVFLIELSFPLRRFPRCHQMIVFTFVITPNFKDNGVQQTAHPANGAKLLGCSRSSINPVRAETSPLPPQILCRESGQLVISGFFSRQSETVCPYNPHTA
jgi:hypothetical protein